MTPKLLRRLKILEGSLVDHPANQHARVLLWKRKENPMPQPDDETRELLEHLQNQLGDLTKSNADLTARASEAEKALEAAQKELTKARKESASGGGGDEDDDPILKGLSPAARQAFEDMRKRADEYEDRLRKQEERSEIEAAEKRIAKEFPSLPFKPGNFAPIYRKISKALQPDEMISLEKIFRSHAAFAQLADRDVGFYGDTGLDGDGGADAMAAIEAKAKELRKLDPKLTKEQAIDKVMVNEPELYKRYRQEIM